MIRRIEPIITAALLLGIMCSAYASENVEVETDGIAQETEISSSVTNDGILGTWNGTYDGHYGSDIIKRDFAISVGKFVEGEISGVAYINDGVDGSYFFTGYLDPDTGEISFYGQDWYDNPGGFDFSDYEGNYDAKTGTINGIVDRNEQRTFSLSKISDDYEDTSISREDVLSLWTGEYDGNGPSGVCRRNIEIEITSASEEGDIEAKVYISPSDLADIYDSVFGRYYANGTIDYESGVVHLQGYEWIWYPVPAVEGNTHAVDNFVFIEFDGRLVAGEGKITGYTEYGLWEMQNTSLDGSVIAAELAENVKVGDRIGIGKYDTDGYDDDEESLQWTVLDKDGTKVLVLSTYVIDTMAYNDEMTETSWEDSNVRKWLNEDFYKRHFSETQQKMILETNETEDTTDRIFLLSVDEVNAFFPGSDGARAPITDMVKENKAIITSAPDGEACGAWLLRTNGVNDTMVSFVDPAGSVNETGVAVNADYVGVRPAMWVDLSYDE